MLGTIAPQGMEVREQGRSDGDGDGDGDGDSILAALHNILIAQKDILVAQHSILVPSEHTLHSPHARKRDRGRLFPLKNKNSDSL